MLKSGKFATILAVMAIAQPAQACWTNSESDAAKIANLNMMMMVSALRCRKGPDDFLGQYNAFVKNNNHIIGTQNAAVRAHFARISGSGNADAAMDKFVIGLANSYGSGHPDLGCADLKRIAQEISVSGHTAGSLLAIADTTVVDARLSGGRCGVTIAAK